MSEIQTVYKVVESISFGRGAQATHHSAVVSSHTACEYATGSKTYPRYGYLFAFNTMEAAIDFTVTILQHDDDDDDDERTIGIWEAQAQVVPPRTHHLRARYYDTIPAFWQLYAQGQMDGVPSGSITRTGKDAVRWAEAPAGTVYCEWIELTKPIPWAKIEGYEGDDEGEGEGE